ncbi:glucans biosynthesis glucosyltransferase MdoH [Sphingomonas bacterium]|uniref:glucans biosynthesis glucosyltransferase MdoH n=1 Tax=Sphingomonas bacterium TaxID=1895847 RepID=UPI001575D873|nr:glucans biosynthesis glucosyltransferase MdoH [Sphingomonas bacterium]
MSSAVDFRSIVMWLPICAMASTASLVIGGILETGGSPYYWIAVALLGFPAFFSSLVLWPTLIGAWLNSRRPWSPVPIAARSDAATAVTLAVRNEDVTALRAHLVRLADQLKTVRAASVDLWLLSDTDDDIIAADELAMIRELRDSAIPIRYRRRTAGASRKHGNLLDFAVCQGSGYRYMIVLDADSTVTGFAIEAMIGSIAEDPRVAVVQTVPYPSGLNTLYARWLQFGAMLYTPDWVRGTAWLQNGRCAYWGHNAIIEVAAFVSNGRLPRLPGRPPLGGEILSHDAIESANFIASGKRICLSPADVGSREQIPANLVDSLARERRWCEGNLQNLRWAAISGIARDARAGIVMDAAYYLKSVAYLLLVADLVIRSATVGFWRSLGAIVAIWLLTVTHKFVSLAANLLDAGRERLPGDAGRKFWSFGAELVLATLVQPISLLGNLLSVCSIARGVSAGWDPQPRGDRELGLRESARRMMPISSASLAAIVAVAVVLGSEAGALLLVMSVGAVAAVPVAWTTSRIRLGVHARSLGLFLIREEASVSARPEPGRGAMDQPRDDRREASTG